MYAYIRYNCISKQRKQNDMRTLNKRFEYKVTNTETGKFEYVHGVSVNIALFNMITAGVSAANIFIEKYCDVNETFASASYAINNGLISI